jgi:hypothetical protein
MMDFSYLAPACSRLDEPEVEKRQSGRKRLRSLRN